MILRVDGWEARLRGLIADYRGRRFEWGVTDCGTFALDAWRAMTLDDPPIVDTWSTITEAATLLHDHGGVEGLASRWFASDPVAGLNARRGDVVSFDASRTGLGERGLGVSVGPSIAVLVDPTVKPGLEFLSLGKALKAWRTGEL